MKQFHIHKDTMKYLTDNNLSLNAKGFLSIVLFNDGINSFDVQKYCIDNKETIKTTLLELRINKLTEKVESQEEQIDELRQDNFNLKYRLQQLEYLFKKLVNFLKRMINRKDKENIYVEVVDDMYNNQIISEKTYDEVLGYNNPVQEKNNKEKDDFEL